MYKSLINQIETDLCSTGTIIVLSDTLYYNLYKVSGGTMARVKLDDFSKIRK